MIVLGLNAYGHDAAAVLLVDGAVAYAGSEERKDRVRHSGAFPSRTIGAALEHANLRPTDVDVVAFPWSRGMARVRKALHVLRGLPRSLAFVRERPDPALPTRRGYLRAMAGLPHDLAAAGLAAPLVRVPHHLAHARSALLCFADPQLPTAVLTADGMGEWATTTLWSAARGRARALATSNFPHSAGKAYAAVTAWLGFRPESDEGKTMGLAAYGDPTSLRARFARRLLTPHPRHVLRVDTARFGFPWGEARLYGPAFLAELGPARRPDEGLRPGDADVARGIQEALEEVLLAASRQALAGVRTNRLGLAGGVFLNCALNGRLRAELGAEVRPFPVAGDAGAAWGAASWVHERRTGRSAAGLSTLRLGHDLTAAQAARAAPGGEPLSDDVLAQRVARALAAGWVVGLARGRAELGPRALGGRSVLASPRHAALRDDVNRRKGREAWRPLAPVVRAGAGHWFPGLGESPHMIATYRASAQGLRDLPGGIHVDGSARVQTVTREGEPFLHAVLDRLEEIGHPAALLNTSLNRRGEPIVDDAAQALEAAVAMGLDALVLADRWVTLRGETAHTP